MSNYHNLIQNYKQQLRSAVTCYEEIFKSTNTSISTNRAQDILHLESIWHECNDPFKLRHATIEACKNFKRGWLGRSRLSNKIMQVINLQIYSEYEFALHLKAEYDALKLHLGNINTSINLHDLQSENSNLKKTNHNLQQINNTLLIANSKLSAQVQKLHIKLQRQQDSDDDLSPTSEVMNDFRKLSALE